jgi:hypothetical protein
VSTDARRFSCPKCGAEPGKKCRTLTTNRSTDDHDARWHRAYNARMGYGDPAEWSQP